MTDKQLLQAYKNALYVARLPHATVELRVGQSCPELADWLAAQCIDTAAFITAFNPRSNVLSVAENEKRQAQLLADVAQLGLATCDGYGTDEGGDWPREISLLVLGISRAQAQGLAEKYGQNAFLFVERFVERFARAGDVVQLCLSEKFADQLQGNMRQT